LKQTQENELIEKSCSYLNPGLVQLGHARQFFTHVNIRVVALAEGRLQLLQLLLGERGSVPTPGWRGRHRGRAGLRRVAVRLDLFERAI